MAHAAPFLPVPTVQQPNPSKMKPSSIILRPILPALLALSATLFGTIAIAQTWGCFTPPPSACSVRDPDGTFVRQVPLR